MKIKLFSLSIVLLLALVVTWPTFASELIAEKFTSDNIESSFDNVRFDDYQGKRALSIDVKATVNTSFRRRDVNLSGLDLVMYSPRNKTLVNWSVSPTLFNSSKHGTIIRLSPSGKKLLKDEIPSGTVSSLETESKDSQIGSLLYILPDDFVLIHSIRYDGKTGAVRQGSNQYINIDKFDKDSLWQVLSEVEIPTQSHMYLLNIFFEVDRFLELNESLKQAW